MGLDLSVSAMVVISRWGGYPLSPATHHTKVLLESKVVVGVIYLWSG